jgi:hypothetical protein
VNGEVVRCIPAVKDHFVNQDLEVMELKSNLPEGLADLVDQRAAYGGLSYPNLQFYTFVAKVEACYSRLANSRNLKIFGGTVLGAICHCITQHKSIITQFCSFFEEGRFSNNAINGAICYYVKMFGTCAENTTHYFIKQQLLG